MDGDELARNTQFFTQRMVVKQMARATLPLQAVVLFGIVQGFRFGFTDADYLVLIFGSVLALVTMFFFGILEVHKALNKPIRPWMFFATIGGLVPHLFALYLIGWRGLWRLLSLWGDFEIMSLASGGVFLLLGYWFLRSYWRVTEIRSDDIRTSLSGIDITEKNSGA